MIPQDRLDESAFIAVRAIGSPLLRGEIPFLARVPNVILADLLAATSETMTRNIERQPSRSSDCSTPTTSGPGA